MKNIGIILLLVGIGIFILFGGVGFLSLLLSPETPFLLKAAILSVCGGIILIFIAAVNEKTKKKDKYEEVEK
jgi:hypothetical protein